MPTDSNRASLSAPDSVLHALLGAVFSGFAHPVIIKDAQLRFVHVNAPACAMLGRAAPELLGRTDDAIVPAAQAARIAAVDREILASGEPRAFEEAITTPDGEARHLLTHKHRIAPPGAREPLILTMITDVTELRHAERRQRHSEAHYRALVDLLPQVVWVADARGQVTEIGPTWSRLSGRAAEAAYGSGWESAVHAQDLPRVRRQWRTSVTSGAPLDVQCRVRAADGTFRWVRNRAAARRDARGRIVAWHGLLEDIHERKRAELALRESEALVRSIVESTPDGIQLLDAEGELLLVNPAGRRLFGAPTAADGQGRRWDRVLAPGDLAKGARALAQVRAGRVARFEAYVTPRERPGLCMDIIAAPVPGADGKPARTLTIWRDISGAKAARDATEAARRAAEAAAAKLAAVLENTLDCVVVLDREWRLSYMNANARRLLSLGNEAIGQSLWTLYPQEQNGVFADHYRKALATHLPVTFEEYLPALSRWLEVHAAPTDEGLSIFFRDTSERRRAEQERFQAQAQVFHMSRHDALTTLPNRVLLRERLERGLAELEPGAHLSVLTLDLDAFKPVNDTYGHPVGDMLLRHIADRLNGCVREEDTVARVGGDEFVVLTRHGGAAAEAPALAARLIDALQRPFDLDGVSVEISACAGIALAPDDGTRVEALLRASDVALYRAKAQGRGTCLRYVPGMDTPLLARQAMKVALKGAIARDELELFFQPLVDLSSKRVSACEALLRWRQADAGLVSPADFIPLAEESGLIHAIGQWVLRGACQEAVRWTDDIAVAVNLSPLQFRDENLVAVVAQALTDAGLAAARLQLEITESVMLDESAANLRTLQALRRLGVKIVMDDFGTGYSSFGYLRRFPFDKIKVDRGFINDLPHGRESLAVVRAVAGIGRSLGITTVVEGVETQAQLEVVSAEGFDEGQGYLFSGPVPAAQVPALLHRLTRRPPEAGPGTANETPQ
ncbi:bifunctional diguanylate cyclase/phosphodiesterase [Pandoraea oxalativorans]|uniref:Diguanylate cyclase n=1 Tax=Pandoraea oxalativorans TaxID=573737 RepID=A0A0G3IGE0_9BURK|nr:EAL domain-containing protein [Pandoraea oxalativorans]AKK24926.2 hypothetical protein MB84_29040 [Pandoraea oxalativorans]